jgi:SWI/SNF-related matrix-associated actin-dependent regulator 1 of chromatin subfamily A
VIDTLMSALQQFQPVKIDGRTNQSQREAAVEAFQTDPNCRVFVGQLQAASTAITLTAASNVLFAEADWTPAINAQAAARAHRIGQPSAVTARFVMLDGTSDALVMKALARKAADISALTEQLV